MGRHQRLRVPGGTFHIVARGVRRSRIFTDDSERALFIRLLARTVRIEGWFLLAFCLMDTHFHLVVEAPAGDLGRGMHRLNGSYAQVFNQIHGFNGHVFESRYRAALVESNSHMLELARYVALNPVRAGLASTAAAWPWSSYPSTIGRGPPLSFVATERLLSTFGDGPPARARTRFKRFVED